MLRRVCGLLASVLPVILLASCGARTAGYGVVLWGETVGALSTGTIVPVVRETPINSSYLLAVPGENKPREFPMGRIRFFHARKDAEDFSRAFAPYGEEWAVSMKQDPPPLPVREQGSQEGRVIYKLKPGQLIKVVSRSPSRETVQQYADYWYEVVTEDGYSGFCFGHYLKTFATAGDPSREARRILSQDEALDRIMGNTWRPDWFREMVARGAIDLAIFREDVGLFPSPSDSIFRLVLPQYSVEFPYTGVQKLGESTYAFTGSDLRVTVVDEERISIYYHYKDQRMAGLYTLMKQDVGDLIAAEQKRRQAIFDSIAARGTSFNSSAYGTISVSPDMRFTWTGYQKLVPSLIPADAQGKGRVDFPLHAAKELAGDYDGVITFVFDRAGDPGTSSAPGSPAAAYSASFLYKATAGGLRFTSLDRDSVTNLVVTHPGISPTVIFLTQSSH
ncbi:MAG TPA: SH3 domain-containing protein [Spirochaetia bacterium]|nr:SH3 domain-containing protein [Spirochaetia bacterium]